MNCFDEDSDHMGVKDGYIRRIPLEHLFQLYHVNFHHFVALI